MVVLDFESLSCCFDCFIGIITEKLVSNWDVFIVIHNDAMSFGSACCSYYRLRMDSSC